MPLAANPVLAVGMPTGYGAILWTLQIVFMSAPDVEINGVAHHRSSMYHEGERCTHYECGNS